jgi:hypothetical protein
MRRVLAFFVVAAVALALPVLAADQAPASPPQKAAANPPQKAPASPTLHTYGQVSKWDAVKKSFSLKTGKNGKHEIPFVFNEKTKFEGVPAIGEVVDVQYVKEGLNTFVAEKIKLRSAKPAAK